MYYVRSTIPGAGAAVVGAPVVCGLGALVGGAIVGADVVGGGVVVGTAVVRAAVIEGGDVVVGPTGEGGIKYT